MIFIVTALDCEARPLIQHYKMRRCQQFKPFPLYQGDNISLVVSGIGATNAMLATATLAGMNAGQSVDSHTGMPMTHPRQPNRSVNSTPNPIIARVPGSQIPEVAWLNIGIGGHQHYAIGSAFLAHKVTNSTVISDSATADSEAGDSGTTAGAKGNTYYPLWAGKWPCATENILTVSKAVTDYPKQVIYEMEGIGFCEAAYRFSTVELVHLLKVISDNKMQSIDAINKSSITCLMDEQMPLISSIVESLQHTAAGLNNLSDLPNDYESLVRHYPVSVSMQFQLKQVLRRWQLLTENSVLDVVPIEKYQSIKQWLKVATEKVALLPVSF